MGLNIPPDVNPMPSSSPDGGKEHEFDIMQNEVIGGLSGWMGFVGIMMLIFGALYAVLGLLNFASVAGMLTIGQGVCLLLIGGWLWGASRSFKMIVTTEGMDITLLMDALKKLRSVYTLQGILLIIACVLIIGMIFLLIGTMKSGAM
jgi:hypothetical protein